MRGVNGLPKTRETLLPETKVHPKTELVQTAGLPGRWTTTGVAVMQNASIAEGSKWYGDGRTMAGVARCRV